MHVHTQRFQFLDALRGFAIAGMIMVNTPGSWAHVHPWLRHAEWHGCRPADLVFPFFLFAAGASLACRRVLKPATLTLPGIVRRCLVLFSLGLLLNCLNPALHFVSGTGDAAAALRIMGVLQRIALAWGAAACIVLLLRPRFWLPCALALLSLHWLLLAAIPVPGFGSGHLTLQANAAGFIDRSLLGIEHMRGPVDPEGLLGTLPCIAAVLLGACAGFVLQRRALHVSTTLLVLGAGAALIACGLAWSCVLPLNKTLWTGSFTLYSTGWALVCCAVFYQALEVGRMRSAGFALEVLGRNALFVFVACGVLARLLLFFRTSDNISWYAALYTRVFVPAFGPDLGSLLFPLAFLAFFWPLLYWMQKKSLFVRV